MEIKCAHTEVVDVDLLVPNPRNPNKHPDSQITLLAKIMKHQGWRSPIVVSNRSGFITKGHGRLQAARLNGWTSAPVDRQDYATEADEYADMVADNKIAELSETDLAMVNEDALLLPDDFDLEMLGIPDFEAVEIEELDPQCDPDHMPEEFETRAKSGDLWKMGESLLKVGDSTAIEDVAHLMGGDKAELCFTSPPYADQREYNGGKDLSTEHLATFIRAAYGSVKYFAVNLGYARKNGEVFQYWDDYIKEARNCGLKLLSWNVWDKGEAGSIGNQTAMFAIEHEWIFVFGDKAKELNLTVANKNLGKNRHGTIRQKDGSVSPVKNKDEKVREFSQLKTVIHQTPQKARNHGLDHPAMFPVEFPQQYIEACTNPGDIIYEPFGGSGTTLIATVDLGRKCRIMELDPKYADMILARWERFTGKKAELVNV